MSRHFVFACRSNAKAGRLPQPGRHNEGKTQWKLLGARTLLGAPGLTTSNKKLLGPFRVVAGGDKFKNERQGERIERTQLIANLSY